MTEIPQAPQPEKKQNVFERMAGVLFAPAETFQNIVRRPDILFFSTARVGLIGKKAMEGPPDLCVEVISPSSGTIFIAADVDRSLRERAAGDGRFDVLDRPAPLNGTRRDGPMLDSAIANPDDSAPGRPGRAYALYPFPLRHGMTMGEMALYYNTALGLNAPLHVIPMSGWRRSMWFDDTKLPWVRPSPNRTSRASPASVRSFSVR